jgi:Cation efflux family
VTHGRSHSHGLVDASITRSRAGIRAVSLSLAVLGLTAAIQAVIFVATDSIALLADLIHNLGDALTALPLGVAFALRSPRAEGYAGLAVVGAIFISACVVAYEAVARLIEPEAPDHLVALGLAGVAGFAGNYVAARIRTRAGKRLDSPALVADGAHARADALVSLGSLPLRSSLRSDWKSPIRSSAWPSQSSSSESPGSPGVLSDTDWRTPSRLETGERSRHSFDSLMSASFACSLPMPRASAPRGRMRLRGVSKIPA